MSAQTEVTQDQKIIMRHFINAVHKALEIHSSKVLEFESLFDSGAHVPENVKKEMDARISQDYAVLWDMISSCIEASVEQNTE